MGEPNELKRLGNLAAEWETRANCATAEVERLTEQLREASMTAALEAQTSADLRSVNDTLRAQLAEAQRGSSEFQARAKAADEHRLDVAAEVERLRAEVADVRTFANFEANKARALAEQLRSGPVTCAKWVEGEDGHRLVIPETLLGSVLDSDPSDSSVSWRVEPTIEWGVQSGTVDDRGNVAAAKRIVEALTGVRP
jgi:hypothetical protein